MAAPLDMAEPSVTLETEESEMKSSKLGTKELYVLLLIPDRYIESTNWSKQNNNFATIAMNR